MDEILVIVIVVIVASIYIFFRMGGAALLGIDTTEWVMNRSAVFWLLCLMGLLVLAIWQVQWLLTQPAAAFAAIGNIVIVGFGILICAMLLVMSLEKEDSKETSDTESLE